MADGEAPAKKSDLKVRVLSAIVMVAIAGTALWLGGWVWTAFVVAVALGVLWEWWGLVTKIPTSTSRRTIWLVLGVAYIGTASATLAVMRSDTVGMRWLLDLVCAVIATDVGAYFAGRTFGGPKIAPSISPSKTWSGLFGGALAAATVVAVSDLLKAANPFCDSNYPEFCGYLELLQAIAAWLLVGSLLAIVAQSGDFFESWMKRRAGVKDSSKLIPGHGGLFDRVDGLLAVLFIFGLFSLHRFI